MGERGSDSGEGEWEGRWGGVGEKEKKKCLTSKFSNFALGPKTHQLGKSGCFCIKFRLQNWYSFMRFYFIFLFPFRYFLFSLFSFSLLFPPLFSFSPPPLPPSFFPHAYLK